VLAVNAGETEADITKYFADNHISGLMVPLDSQLDAYTAYDIEAMPTTFVIDKAGVVRFKHLGALTYDDLYTYVDQLTKDGT
jgi:hypothetical protein